MCNRPFSLYVFVPWLLDHPLSFHHMLDNQTALRVFDNTTALRVVFYQPIENFILCICRVFKRESEYKCRQITTNLYTRRLRLRFTRF